MIPAEAVEAALVAFSQAPYDPPPLTEEDVRSANRDQMHAALEAAAPYIRAQALEDAAAKFGEAASWSDSRPTPEQVQRWLRAGAAAERDAK